MDTNELPLELTKALTKAEKNNSRAVRASGYGASDVGLKLTKDCLWTLAEFLGERRKQPLGTDPVSSFLRTVEPLSDELLALCTLQVSIHAVAVNMPRTSLLRAIGRAVSAECWAAGLTMDNPKLAARIEKTVRARNHGTVKQRQKAAKAFAARKGYLEKDWEPELEVDAGTWLIDQLVLALPEMFSWTPQRAEDGSAAAEALTINPEALAIAEEVVAEGILRRPVHVPRLTPPTPWTGWGMTNDDPRVSFRNTFLRTHHKDVAAAFRAAVKAGTAQPALDAVNALQAVPYTINTRILSVIKECIARKIDVSSLPAHSDVPVPVLTKSWEELKEDERELYSIQRAEAEKVNLALQGERLMLVEDMATADWLSVADCYYTPMNCDWRGRVYSLCHFNFMRDDRVRALFQFRDGMPIGEEGLKWLKIHVANCGAFNKIDKAPLSDRITWVDENISTLQTIAAHPLSQDSLDLWTTADSPFLFLAAVIELCAALECGAQYVTHLPVSFDGSCSGLQHLSAMTRDQTTAAMVNLLPLEKPSDVYSIIAADVKERVQRDTTDPELARLFLAFGIDRKTAKRNVMTYSYSSKKHGMAGQQQVDLMEDLKKQVLRKTLPSHPFAPYHRGTQERPGKAARYIAGHVYEAIEARINRPAMAMKFLQGLAKALAHEAKPVRWTTPDGIPWVNRYHPPVLSSLRLWLHDKGFPRKIQVTIATGDAKEIDKEKAANGIAPNFVHALDAAHLKLTVNASVAEGIRSIATVHDSFGCLAPQAARFNQIIRAELVRMYETHDVLAEVFEQAKCDLTQHNCDRLPPVPDYGTLNLKEIENSPYAFA